MGDTYSNVGAVVGATYPEMGKVLRKVMPKVISLFLVTGHRVARLKTLQHSLTQTDLAR